MDAVQRIVTALAAGATATFRPNPYAVDSAIQDEFDRLKSLIQKQYRGVDVDQLDIAPGSAERRQLLSEQLQNNGAHQDEDVLQQAQTLLDVIAERDESALAAKEPTEKVPHND